MSIGETGKHISRQERDAIIRWGVAEKNRNSKFSVHDIGERLEKLGCVKGQRTLDRLMSEIKMAAESEKYLSQLETTFGWNNGSLAPMLLKCPVIVRKVHEGFWPLCDRPASYMVQGSMLCESHARHSLHIRDHAGRPVVQPPNEDICQPGTHSILPGEHRCLCGEGRK